jgi:hypothetical protein
MIQVISYFTNDSYRQQAEEMAQSARSVGLSVTLYSRPDTGHWHTGCNYKAGVVLSALHEFKGEPVLFLDADTRVRAYPVLLNNLDADFAAFFLEPTVPSGGCLWFNGRRGVRYAEAWAKQVSDHPEREDDSLNFSAALASVQPASIYRLPPSYNWHDSMRGSFPGASPVIEHLFVGHHNYPVNRTKEQQHG